MHHMKRDKQGYITNEMERVPRSWNTIILAIILLLIYLSSEYGGIDILTPTYKLAVLPQNPIPTHANSFLEPMLNGEGRSPGKFKKAEARRLEESKKRVILFCYMRSGSTFLGNLFNHRNDVAYLFEPLAYFFTKNEKLLSEDKHLTWKKAETPENDTNVIQAIRQFLSQVMHCDFTYETLVNFFYMGATDNKLALQMGYFNPKLFYSKSSFVVKTFQENPSEFTAEKLRENCLKKSIVVAKIIRINYLSQLAEWLEQNEDTHLIHLIRDPRAIANSRRFLGVGNSRTTNTICHYMLKNLETSDRLMSLKNFHIVRYEDLAKNTTTEVERLLNGIGLPYDKDTAYWVQKNSRNYEEDNDLNHWKMELDRGVIQSFDESQECRDIYERLGYETYEDET